MMRGVRASSMRMLSTSSMIQKLKGVSARRTSSAADYGQAAVQAARAMASAAGATSACTQCIQVRPPVHLHEPPELSRARALTRPISRHACPHARLLRTLHELSCGHAWASHKGQRPVTS